MRFVSVIGHPSHQLTRWLDRYSSKGLLFRWHSFILTGCFTLPLRFFPVEIGATKTWQTSGKRSCDCQVFSQNYGFLSSHSSNIPGPSSLGAKCFIGTPWKVLVDNKGVAILIVSFQPDLLQDLFPSPVMSISICYPIHLFLAIWL